MRFLAFLYAMVEVEKQQSIFFISKVNCFIDISKIGVILFLIMLQNGY